MDPNELTPPGDSDETATDPDVATQPTRERIGPYSIVGVLGEGGMGIVYVAEQSEPVKRRVALKVIKQGMDSARVLARFDAERQALALMDHPAIATIYDAGTTPDGRPYFAMEYVKGIPITEHCDLEKLTNRERLELFTQVCEGIQHAHQKAVIHRDLKPSNVLVSVVDGRPAVKIIDFGVAKAIAQPLTEKTLYTELGVMIGTPEYMSPEQAEMTGQDVDTRSDVYSLGVLLYELLVGALPFEAKELRQAGLDEIRRRIREDEPPRPSARISTLGDRSTESARRRRTEPNALRRELLGDLDWITMRALEKDRARRYGSPSELAADIGRHLRDEPVLAHAPSTTYRARKFVRRHRLGVAAASVMVLGLTAGALGSTVGLVRARRAEAIARQEAQAKGQVADFLKNLFKVSSPSESRGNSITARELLDKAAGTIDTQLKDQPKVQADLAAIMGEVYQSLGLYTPAESLATKALEIRKRVLGPEHADTLRSMNELGNAYRLQGQYREAERLLSQVMETRKRVLGPEHPDTLASMNDLGIVYWRQARYAEAERLLSETVELRKRVLGLEHPDTLWSMNNLALVYLNQGRYAESERLHARTLEIRKRVLGAEHPNTLASMHNLAHTFSGQHREPEAERLLSETLDLEKRVFGAEHPDTLRSTNEMAGVLLKLGRYSEAEQLQSETLDTQRRVLGPEHPDTLSSMNNLALTYQNQGRLTEAEKLESETLEIRNRVLGPEHPLTLRAAFILATMCVQHGRHLEAERLFSRVLETRKRVLGPKHPDTIRCLYNLACVSALRRDRTKATDWLRQTVEAGYSNPDEMLHDADLESLHGPEFDALVERARQNAAAAALAAGRNP